MTTRTRTHRIRRTLLAAAAAALTLTAAGCSLVTDKPAPARPAQPSTSAVPAESTGPTPQSDGRVLAQVDGEGDLTLRITSAERSHGGTWLTVRGSITNNGTKNFYGTNAWRGDFRDMPKSPGSVSGAALVDEASMKRYYVLRDTTGLCLCTTRINQINVGKSMAFAAQFPAPPASSTRLGFELPTFPVASLVLGG
ncbi:hypothetical protein ACWGI8_05800 [Streptomyces sp. NPDC054841]